jgi:hypothetical protein
MIEISPLERDIPKILEEAGLGVRVTSRLRSLSSFGLKHLL